MNALRCILLVVVAAGCSGTQPASDGSDEASKHGTLTGMLHLTASLQLPWCSGAEPDPSEWPRTVPWSGTLYLRRARPDSTGRFALNDTRLPIIDSLRTDGTGNGHASLPPGTYLLLDRDRVDRSRHDRLLRDFAQPSAHRAAVDKDCLAAWLHGPFELVTIDPGDTTHVMRTFSGTCSWNSVPCAAWNGPLPP